MTACPWALKGRTSPSRARLLICAFAMRPPPPVERAGRRTRPADRADPGTGSVGRLGGRTSQRAHHAQVSGVGTSVNFGSRWAVSLYLRITHGLGIATSWEMEALSAPRKSNGDAPLASAI